MTTTDKIFNITPDNVFDLTPDEFRAREWAEQCVEAERREAKLRAEEKAAEEAAHKKEAAARAEIEAQTRHALRWRRWLTHIGNASGASFEVRTRDPYNSYRPCELMIDGVQIPVSEGIGSGMSLEITMPWHTRRHPTLHDQHPRVDTTRSRQKKDGSFNYEALGRIAARYAVVERQYRTAEAVKKSSAALISGLVSELSYTNIIPSTDPEKPVCFQFTIARNMTAPEVRHVVMTLRAAGLLKQKGK